MRSLMVERRTAQINQIRGLLLEYGLDIPQGRTVLARRLPEILEEADNGLIARFRAELNAAIHGQFLMSTRRAMRGSCRSWVSPKRKPPGSVNPK
jgi:hypothetical protein